MAYALASHSASIAYTYTEPTIFMEYAQDVGKLAHEQGLKNVFVSNGFMTEASAAALAEFVDGDNVDLKSMRDDFYRKICKARLQPVLDTIVRLKQAGVWLEVTTLVIPGHNDSTEELTEIAQFIKGVGVDIPWHVTAFHPTFKMMDRPATPVATLRRAREIGLKAGLRYVYTGNIPPGEGGENTYCYGCQELLIERQGYTIRRYHLKDGKCPKCQTAIDGGVEMKGAKGNTGLGEGIKSILYFDTLTYFFHGGFRKGGNLEVFSNAARGLSRWSGGLYPAGEPRRAKPGPGFG